MNRKYTIYKDNDIVRLYSVNRRLALSLYGFFAVLKAHSNYINSKLKFYEKGNSIANANSGSCIM